MTRLQVVGMVFQLASFLSRIPYWRLAKRLGAGAELDFAKSAWAMPAAAVLVVWPATVLLLLLWQLEAPIYIAAALTIGCTALVTGFLHEDGLADVADGFGGGSTSERKLEIMRDSTIGTYGTAVLILTIGLRVLALGALISVSPLLAAFIYLLIAVASRTAMLWPWSRSQAAREAGLSASHGTPGKKSSFIAIGLVVAIVLIFLTALVGFAVACLVLVTMALVTWLFQRFCQGQIGGQTGDTLGATQQLVELSALTMLALSL
jgi:adenosylcobinamide-GDP ribazoletransferase